MGYWKPRGCSLIVEKIIIIAPVMLAALFLVILLHLNPLNPSIEEETAHLFPARISISFRPASTLPFLPLQAAHQTSDLYRSKPSSHHH